jgi:hypothetical protein
MNSMAKVTNLNGIEPTNDIAARLAQLLDRYGPGARGSAAGRPQTVPYLLEAVA